MCRTCFREYNRVRYVANAEAIKARVRAHAVANAERVNAAQRAAYWRDVEASRAYARAVALVQNAKPERKAAKRAWARADRAANPEKWRERGRREYRQNPLARAEICWRRSARKAATKALRVTPALLRAKWAYWGGLCWMCRLAACEWDHVKPLSVGGYHCLANLRPACRSCNASKGNTWPWPREENH